MAIVPLTEEDKLKLTIYSLIKVGEIGDYTRECMRTYDFTAPKTKEKLLKNLKKKQSLEDGLLECAVQFSEADEQNRKKINRRAMSLIKRCCKGKFDFVREYVRLYKEMRIGFFSIADVYDENLHEEPNAF